MSGHDLLLVLCDERPPDGRAAAIGFCFGGLVALQLAKSGEPFAAAVSIHGSLATSTPAESGQVKARVLVCHGALDPHVPLVRARGRRLHQRVSLIEHEQFGVTGQGDDQATCCLSPCLSPLKCVRAFLSSQPLAASKG